MAMGKSIDLSGRRFGRLQVIKQTDQRDGSGIVWHCRCDCGQEVDVPARNLLHRGTVSCGCRRKQNAVDNLSGAAAAKLGQVDGTNVSRLRATKPQTNNRSGYRGVSWHPYPHGGGRWIAVIYFKRRRYRLGFYDTPEEAALAYAEAKKHIHGDFISWYDSKEDKS